MGMEELAGSFVEALTSDDFLNAVDAIDTMTRDIVYEIIASAADAEIEAAVPVYATAKEACRLVGDVCMSKLYAFRHEIVSRICGLIGLDYVIDAIISALKAIPSSIRHAYTKGVRTYKKLGDILHGRISISEILSAADDVWNNIQLVVSVAEYLWNEFGVKVFEFGLDTTWFLVLSMTSGLEDVSTALLAAASPAAGKALVDALGGAMADVDLPLANEFINALDAVSDIACFIDPFC